MVNYVDVTDYMEIGTEVHKDSGINASYLSIVMVMN